MATSDFPVVPDSLIFENLSSPMRVLFILPLEPITTMQAGEMAGFEGILDKRKVNKAMSHLSGRALVKWVSVGMYRITPLGLEIQARLRGHVSRVQVNVRT